MKAQDSPGKEAPWPAGFLAAGLHAGIKQHDRKDLALVVSEDEAAVAGTFTTNAVQAAPVRLCRERVRRGTARAVVVNSGNANACTGEQGRRDAERTAALTAELLGAPEAGVLVCSTGPIGKPLPMDRVAAALPRLVERLAAGGGDDFAEAILTTDTRSKRAARRIQVDGRQATVCGMAKGSGMIAPNMATMLAFLITDARIEPAPLQDCLAAAVRETFNRISVDGDTSTNDSVLCLANGRAGNAALQPGQAGWPAFRGALAEVCRELAEAIVADGEGATRRVRVAVEGAADDGEAERAARAVADSLLVKTSWAGGRANWGRVMAALGRSGARLDEARVSIDYDDVPAVRGGIAAESSAPEALNRVAAQTAFTLRIGLGAGSGRASVLTCDCTEDYVRINV